MVDEDQWARWVRQAKNGVQKLWETNQGGKLLAESKNFFMQENSKSRMFNYNKCIVLLGCIWMPVSPELPERGGREPESCCCGFAVTLGKLKSNQ